MAEITADLKNITKESALSSLNIDALYHIKMITSQYKEGHISRSVMLKMLKTANERDKKIINKVLNGYLSKNKNLSAVRYESHFDQIIIQINGKNDTIVLNNSAPVIYAGKNFDRANNDRINNGLAEPWVILDGNTTEENNRNPANYDLKIIRSQNVDISEWQQKVVFRMAFVFILAAVVLIVVVLLFYIVIRALHRERKLSNMKIDFANNITHELQTPLSSLNLVICSLEMEEVKKNPVLMDELLSTLRRQYVKIQHSVNIVLESSIAGRETILLKNTPVVSFLKAYVKEFPAVKHQLHATIRDQEVVLQMDTDLLEKILNNLLENALKYTPDGSVITLEGYLENKHYIIVIGDQGPGIPKRYHKLIFDKFYRIAEQSNQAVKGLGLGLYLCQQGVSALGGDLTLQSMPGKGSRFILKFPVNEN